MVGWSVCGVAVLIGMAQVRVVVPGSAFDVPIYGEITTRALDFIQASILDKIVAANKARDTGGDVTSTHHFDNCCFSGSVEEINSLYRAALDAVKEGKFGEAAVHFGALLHTVQDFYTHSNWVELGMTDLVDKLLDYWKEIKPYTEIATVGLTVAAGIVVIEGDLPKGWEGQFQDERGNPALVPTLKHGGSQYLGLISGVWGIADVPALLRPVLKGKVTLNCPAGVPHHDVLNKDNDTRLNYAQARKLAVDQPRHEYCRLEVLVLRYWGKDDLDALREAWLAPPRSRPVPAWTIFSCAPWIKS